MENMELFNDNTEIVFWKVFHNKFLFKKILFAIEDIIFDYKDDLSKYYLGHKIKFKHISNLKFFTKNDNKEWSILKDKLISNQFIKLEKGAISEFIHFCKNEEILKLFYKKKHNEIPNDLDLISLSLEHSNMISFKIFLDLNYPISSKSIEKAIHYGNVEALKMIFKYRRQEIVEQKYWLKLFRNKYIQLELIEFFLEINDDSESLKQYGANLQDKDKLDFTSFFSIKSLSIKSKLLEYNLVEKNESSSFFIFFIKNYNFGLVKTIQDLLFYIKSFFKLCLNQNEIPLNVQLKIDTIIATTTTTTTTTTTQEKEGDEENKIYNLILILLKEIQNQLHPSQYSHEMKSFFYNFLIKNKSIKGIYHIPSIYYYSFSTFSVEGLEYLLEQYSKSECIFNDYNNNPLNQTILKNKQDQVLKFMTIYYNQEIFKVPNEKVIVKYILLNCDISILESLLLFTKFKNQFINLKFETYEEFSFNKYKLFIKEIKDQIIENDGLKIKISFFNEDEKIEYINFITDKWKELINSQELNGKIINSTFQTFIYPLLYSIDSKNTMKIFLDNFVILLTTPNLTINQDQLFLQLIPFLFEYSVLNSDLETLKFIEDRIGVQLNSYRGLFHKTNFKKSIIEAIDILNHINENSAYYQNHFYNIYQMFSTQFGKSILFQVSFDLNKFQRGIGQIIYFSLIHSDFEFIKEIFEKTNYIINGNTFNQNGNLENEQQFQSIFSVYKKSIYTIESNQTLNFLNIYNFIEFLLDKVKNQESRSLFLESVLNYLYKIILRIKDVSIKQLEMIHSLFKQNQIEIQLELYHILYYIYLKSPKLFKYFYSNLNIINTISTNLNNYIEDNQINLSHFQFENIISSNFEQLFFKIKDNLMIVNHHNQVNGFGTNITNYNFLFNSTLSNIKYLFEVNEYNIVLKNIDKFKLESNLNQDLNAIEIRNTIILNFLKELFSFIEIELFLSVNKCINASIDIIQIAANYNNRLDIINYFNSFLITRIE